VELALRNSSTRGTKYILEPVIGTSFDSLAEAYEFYNLYSWEVGFGIRYGKSYTNGKHYRSSQELICQLQVNTYPHHEYAMFTNHGRVAGRDRNLHSCFMGFYSFLQGFDTREKMIPPVVGARR
jgi:hypothetical protein